MSAGAPDARVDAVVVAYNSARTLRGCVESLLAIDGVAVTVVDNASPDDSIAAVADLPLQVVRAGRNGGFAAGCNLGVAHGSAPHVLLLNPDARVEATAVARLLAPLEREPALALSAPRIVEQDGTLAWSQRRFPRLRSTFAQALFLHRLFPHAGWSDELIRDPAAYARPGSPDWVSGACMLLRRSALEGVGGLDERYFLYCEDIDLCARLRAAGWGVRYEPSATVEHEGGASRPREALLATYARNRVRYARRHARPGVAAIEALGVALGHATHALASLARPPARRGHVRALAAALSPAAGRVGEARGGR